MGPRRPGGRTISLNSRDSSSNGRADIVCLSSIDWDFLWQRHQILMSGLAAAGHRVLFLENMGGRPPRARDASRLVQRALLLVKQFRQGIRVEQSVEILTPAVLPPLSSVVSIINDRVFLPNLVSRIAHLGFRRPIVWTYSPTATAMRLATCLEPSLMVYDCVANIPGYPYATPELIAAEQEWVRRSDVVFTDAGTLYEAKKKQNPNTRRLLPGVNLESFLAASSGPEPADLSALRRPRLCFFGSFGWWIDLEIVQNFAVSHPEWTVVIVGPVRTDIAMLSGLANVVFLGEKPHDALSAYLSHVDVICLPYVLSEFTNGVMPAKLFEALATGKPVVATPIPELRPFSSVIDLADRSGFSGAVMRASETNTPEAAARRVKVAQDNSWSARIVAVDAALEQAMAASHS